jgi:hypothetical protein
MKNRCTICGSTILGDFRFKTHIGTNAPQHRRTPSLTTVQIAPVWLITYVRNDIVTKERTTGSRFFNAPNCVEQQAKELTSKRRSGHCGKIILEIVSVCIAERVSHYDRR